MVAIASLQEPPPRPRDFRAERPGPPIGEILAHPTLRERPDVQLARVVEGEIIPRLMLAHLAADRGEASAGDLVIGSRTLEAFARMTLTSDASTLTGYVEALVEGGVALEDVYVDLLMPVARRLGDDWNEDLISFTDVTIGLGRLQQVVRAFGRYLPTGSAEGAPSGCFVSAPGEQHTFGLMLLEDGFRRAGWRTCLDVSARIESAVGAVAETAFDVFGLSAVSDVEPTVLADVVRRVRQASRNPAVFVMVGGRVFAEAPELADRVGADASCQCLASALCIAREAVKPHAAA